MRIFVSTLLFVAQIFVQPLQAQEFTAVFAVGMLAEVKKRADVNPVDARIGANIRRLRGKSLTQVDVGRHLGFTQSDVSKWENGQQAIPSRLLPELARVLGASIEALFDAPPVGHEGKTAQHASDLHRDLKGDRSEPVGGTFPTALQQEGAADAESASRVQELESRLAESVARIEVLAQLVTKLGADVDTLSATRRTPATKPGARSRRRQRR